jgi:hypothetical protein
MSRNTLAAVLIGACAAIAAGQGVLPRVVITPVVHEGDPVPGMPGVIFAFVWPSPLIDGAGNVLFQAYLSGPGIGSSNDLALFYGPPGESQLLVRESDPAPGFPSGVTISWLYYGWPTLSESGWVGFNAELSGPGIEAGVNDWAMFAGPPGDIRKVYQIGDPAPGLEPGVVFVRQADWIPHPHLSDNATLWVFGYLGGPGVDTTNDEAYWTGTREDLRLVWRKGMQAAGCEPGVTFRSVDLEGHNDAGQMVFRGGLRGEGVDETNDSGYWSGPPGGLESVARGGDQVAGLPEGVFYSSSGTGIPAFNIQGEVFFWMALTGQDVTPENDAGVWLRTGFSTYLVGRDGEPAPEIGTGVIHARVSGGFLNAGGQMFLPVKYAGTGIDSSNAFAVLFGCLGAARLTLRDGDPAPGFSPGTTLWHVNYARGMAALNDVGDVVTTTEIQGPGIAAGNKTIGSAAITTKPAAATAIGRASTTIDSWQSTWSSRMAHMECI